MITGISRQATQFSRLRFLTWALWIINLFFSSLHIYFLSLSGNLKIPLELIFLLGSKTPSQFILFIYLVSILNVLSVPTN